MAKRITYFFSIYVFLGILSLTTFASSAAAQSFMIIVNNSTQTESISTTDLKEIYNGDRVFWKSGKRIRATRLTDDANVTTEFLQLIVLKTPSQYVQHWRHKLFSGKGLPPKVVSDPEKMISYVESTEGSIGFIPAMKINSQKVKILPLTR